MSWNREQEVDFFNEVNEAREAEFQMSKLDFIRQSNKAEITVAASDSLTVRTSILYPFYYPKLVVPVFYVLCLSGLPPLITSPPGPFFNGGIWPGQPFFKNPLFRCSYWLAVIP